MPPCSERILHSCSAKTLRSASWRRDRARKACCRQRTFKGPRTSESVTGRSLHKKAACFRHCQAARLPGCLWLGVGHGRRRGGLRLRRRRHSDLPSAAVRAAGMKRGTRKEPTSPTSHSPRPGPGRLPPLQLEDAGGPPIASHSATSKRLLWRHSASAPSGSGLPIVPQRSNAHQGQKRMPKQVPTVGRASESLALGVTPYRSLPPRPSCSRPPRRQPSTQPAKRAKNVIKYMCTIVARLQLFRLALL